MSVDPGDRGTAFGGLRQWCRRFTGFRDRGSHIAALKPCAEPRPDACAKSRPDARAKPRPDARAESCPEPGYRLSDSVLDRAHREHQWDPGY